MIFTVKPPSHPISINRKPRNSNQHCHTLHAYINKKMFSIQNPYDEDDPRMSIVSFEKYRDAKLAAKYLEKYKLYEVPIYDDIEEIDKITFDNLKYEKNIDNLFELKEIYIIKWCEYDIKEFADLNLFNIIIVNDTINKPYNKQFYYSNKKITEKNIDNLESLFRSNQSNTFRNNN